MLYSFQGCLNTGQPPGGGLYTEKQLRDGEQAAQGHAADGRRNLLMSTAEGGSFQYKPHGRMLFSPRLTPQSTRLGTTYWRPEPCATFQRMFW